MSRRRVISGRDILSDPKYGSELLAKFINMVMVDGKKAVAEKILYDALDQVSTKRKSVPIEWDGSSPIEVVVDVDFEKRQIVATAAGQRVQVGLPDGWRELTACGYGASNAETVFTKLAVE